MNLAAIYHRPESEFAYLYTEKEMRVRFQTAIDDVASVVIVSGDPYKWKDGAWVKTADTPMRKALKTDVHQYWEASLFAPHSRLNYGFIVTGNDGSQIFYGDQGIESTTTSSEDEGGLMGANNYFKMPFFQEIDRFKAPEWVKDTVWYQIFPERFADGDSSNNNEGTSEWNPQDHPKWNEFYGGDLRGIINHFDHLVDLGINGIYFTPIFTAPSNHKYDTENNLEIDSHFGTKDDFRELVELAHSHGIKIMLDAVFNHIGDASPQWQDVLKNGADSKYADWFHVHSFPATYTPGDSYENTEDATYDTFAFTPHMPKWNTANPEVQDYLLNIATYWIKEFDIDAWRLDVANEVDHHFWKRFHQETTALKPDFYIVGEIWTSAQAWLTGDEFSGVMNYAFTGAIVDYFAKRVISIDQFISKLNGQLMLNRDQTNQMMMNMLDSHDAPRILSLAHDNKDIAKQMLVFMFMQQGTPDIYYGTEVGMNGEGDPDNRKPMEWRPEFQDLKMYEFVKKMIALRKSERVVFSDGDLDWKINEEAKIITVIRSFGEKTIYGIFNTDDSDFSVDFDGEELLSNGFVDGVLSANGLLIWVKEV
jgi:neopullulanase